MTNSVISVTQEVEQSGCGAVTLVVVPKPIWLVHKPNLHSITDVGILMEALCAAVAHHADGPDH